MNLFSTPLPDRFISITGPDAVKFLQGQCSCDINELSESHFSFGTLNTPKGRMYCLFKIIKTENGLLLSMHESLLESTLQKLKKYAVFFKCDLKEDNDYQAIGITSDSEQSYNELLNSLSLSSELPLSMANHQNAYWLKISSRENLCEGWINTKLTRPEFLDQSKSLDLEQWYALETSCGIPALYSSSQDEFILQSLNLQQLGAVSFKKGCYTGQEIIARMKFLGKQKKRAYLLKSNEQYTQPPLSSVYDNKGNKCGTLIRSHWSEQTGTHALSILPIESALNFGEVFLNEDLKTPFTISEIDYKEFNK